MRVNAWFLSMVAMLAGCGEFKSVSEAKRTAEAAGLSSVVVRGKHGMAPSLYGCSESDAVAFDVIGTNARGDRVDAVVCCGLVLKACTIRY
jgi:hypothetical protein